MPRAQRRTERGSKGRAPEPGAAAVARLVSDPAPPRPRRRLQSRVLGEDGQPRRAKDGEDPHHLGLVLEWVYGTIVSTAEKSRDGAHRPLGGRAPSAQAALGDLTAALDEQWLWEGRARAARELLGELLASRKEAAELAERFDTRSVAAPPPRRRRGRGRRGGGLCRRRRRGAAGGAAGRGDHLDAEAGGSADRRQAALPGVRAPAGEWHLADPNQRRDDTIRCNCSQSAQCNNSDSPACPFFRCPHHWRAPSEHCARSSPRCLATLTRLAPSAWARRRTARCAP